MRVEELRIRRTPGIDEPFTLTGFAPTGCTLVHAPNGAGKSSTCRALQSLLWPGTEWSEELVVSTRWVVDETPLRAELIAGRTNWQRDGVPCEAPSIPAAHLKDCFTLHVTDLLLPNQVTDSGLSDALRSELAGGFRLDHVRAGFKIGQQHGRIEAIALESEFKKREKILRRFRDLASEEKRIAELGPELEESRAAQKRARILEHALRLADARFDLNRVERELATLPQEAGRLRGDEARRLAETLREEADLSAQLEERASHKADALRALELSGEPPSDESLKLAQIRIEAAERTLAELESLQPEEGRAAVEEKEALRALAGESTGGADPEISTRALDELEGFLRTADALRADRAAHDAKLRTARKRPTDFGDPDVLNAACDLLRRRLSTSPGAGSTSKTQRQSIVISALGFLLLVSGLLLIEPEPVYGALALGAAFALGAWALSLFVGRAGEREMCAQIVTEYEDLGVVEPTDWGRRAVTVRLRSLQRELAHVEKSAAARELYEEQQESLRVEEEELEGREAAHQEGLNEQRRIYGIDAGQSALSLVEWARRIADYRGARAAIVRLDHRLDKLRAELGTCAHALEDLTGGAREAEPAREWIARARAGLHHLQQSGEGQTRAGRDLERAEQELPRLQAALETKRKQRTEIEALAGTEFGAGETAASRLLAWSEKADQVRRTQEEVRARRLTVEGLEAELQGSPELLTQRREDLATELEATEARAGKLEDLVAEEQRLRGALEIARQSDELELANEACMDATLALHDVLEEGRRCTVGAFLLEDVEREMEVESQPEVVREAALLFGRFTRHAYELRIDLTSDSMLAQGAPEGRQLLRAIDVKSGRGLSAHELSDGTRTQLLLAARIAFALHASGASKLPLILDEALALSDPERFDAVVSAFLELEDRQVLYFTSDVEIAARFDRLAAERDLPRPAHIDLGAARGLGTAVQSAKDLALTRPLRPLPSVELDDDEFGARLGVPPADGERPLGELHLFHVLRHDLRVLRPLLAAGKDSVGSYRALAKDFAALRALVPVEEERARIEAMLDLTQVVCDSWHIGRGRRMEAEDLVRCKAVTSAFREKLLEVLAEESGWASGLVQAIEDKRVPGYRKDKFAALCDWLDENDYLDRRERLDEEAIVDRALAAMQPRIAAGVIESEFVLPRARQLLESFERSAAQRDATHEERASLLRSSQEEGARSGDSLPQ